MQRQSAYAITGKLSTAYPGSKVDEKTITDVWVPKLTELDEAVALATADQIVNHDQWFPSWSRFREMYLAVARNRSLDRSGPPALTVGLTPTDEALERIAAIKASIPKGPGRLTMPSVGR